MKIALCCLEWEPIAGGGIRTYVENAASYLMEAGHEVHIVTYRHPGTDTGVSQRGSLKIHRVSFTRLQRLFYRMALAIKADAIAFRIFYGVQVYRCLRALRKAGQLDIVESPDYAAEGLVITLAQKLSKRWRRLPHVVMLHTPTYLLNRINRLRRGPYRRMLEFLENWNIRNARHVSSPSEALRRRVAADLGVKVPIFLDPYPSDLARPDRPAPGASMRAPEAQNPGAIEILYVGRMEHRKGVTLLVDALNLLCPRHPGLRASLVGGDTDSAPGGGSMRRHLEQRLDPKLVDRVRFIDRLPREELFSLYRSASFCVFPSVFENFANTCLEAVALEKVVVVPRDSGMAEMVDDGRSGFVFENCDLDDLVAKIELCLQHRADWPRMGRAGREFVCRKYDPRRMIEQKIQHYESLLGQ